MKTRTPPLTCLALGYLGLTSVLVGVWALFLPRAFYDRFPGFGIWVAGDGPYNEHLVRDVGGLNLSLAMLIWFAWRRPDHVAAPVAGWAVLAYAVTHFLYHSGHLHTLTTQADRLGSVAGLLGAVACALILVRRPLT
ncbi:hypothetical protein GCM10008955_40900 [Deinococcus malanensis]|uniref:DUF4345 domain-containing protein n=1 Tax=Deinococcus malanensis TaxID=1706855 RepID=A0ABQ2F2K6_9DEIO|nr:hypothetical protein [Deinococcus malanensis]GGK42914.1 hypothetical protein GCM10008955_40900 [Deinococcus malanensis]